MVSTTSDFGGDFGGDFGSGGTPSISLKVKTKTTTVLLLWTSIVGTSIYQIFRNGILIATSAVPSFLDTGLASQTTFTYQVFANDVFGNELAFSNIVSATTRQSGSGISSWQEIRDDLERKRILHEFRLLIRWDKERMAALQEELALAARLAGLPRSPKAMHPLIGLIRADREDRDRQETWRDRVEEYELMNPWFGA